MPAYEQLAELDIEQFDEQGYLLVRNALDEETVARHPEG